MINLNSKKWLSLDEAVKHSDCPKAMILDLIENDLVEYVFLNGKYYIDAEDLKVYGDEQAITSFVTKKTK